MDKNEKFNDLVKFLKTVPEVEPTEEEKALMDEVDNDEEYQKRIKDVIDKRRKEMQDNDELSCEELNEVMKYILLKDYFEII